MEEGAGVRREALWNLYREHYAQFRHYETQRSAVAAALVAIVALVMSVIALEGDITYRDFPLTVFVILLGVFGALFASKQFERSSKYAILLKNIELEIDAIIGEASLSTLKAVARQEHHGLFRWSRVVKVHQLWVMLHLIIAVIGIWLSYLSLN